MPIKAVVDSLDELEEPLQAHYAEDEKTSKFVLQVTDFDTHPKIRGVITANRTNLEKKEELKRELEALRARLQGLPEDLTAEAFEELKAKAEAQGDEPAQLSSQKQLYEERIARQKTVLEQQIAAAEARAQKAEASLEGLVVEDGLRNTLRESGVDPNLLEGAMALLKPKIKVKRTSEDVAAIVETDLGEQTLAEFVDNWSQGKQGAAYMAKPEGPNAQGSGKAQTATGDNPFAAKTWNKTLQAKLEPARRETLAKQAGFPDYTTAIRALRPLATT